MEQLPNKQNLSLSKFESMLKTNSIYFFDSTEFEEIIHFYIDSGKLSRAKKAISIGLTQHPNSLHLKILSCEVMILENQIEKAYALLNEIELLDSENEEVYYLKAQIFSKKKNHKKAVELLLKALNLVEEDFDILTMLGMEYMFLDEFDLAREQFEKCLAIEADDYSTLYNIIYCFEMENKFKKAASFLKKYINNDPYNEVAWHQLGRQYFRLGKYKKALRAFDYSVLIDEGFVGGYLEKAKTLEELYRYEEAIENYLKTLKLDDPTAFANYRIGECYRSLNEVNLAIFYYGKAIHEDPLLEKSWLSIIDLYLKENQIEKALDTASKAIDVNEKNAIFWQKYGILSLKKDNLQEAVNAFKNCLLLKNFELEVWIGLSDCFIKAKAYKEAQEVLLQGVKFFNIPEMQNKLDFVSKKLKNS